MTDMQAAPVQGTAPLSTSIDQGGAPLGTGGGVPNLTEPKVAETPTPAKPETAGDTLKAELTRIREEEAKEAKGKGEDAAKDAKAKVDEAEKAEKEKTAKGRSEDGKFAKAKTEGDEPDVAAKADKGEPEKAATERAETDKSRQSESQKYHEPPARFLPEARTKWANVPNEVKAEFHRVSQEFEGEVTKYKQVSERYEPIRQFDELAKSNGRELKDSLAKINEIENTLKRSIPAGIDAILREIGPRKQDGSPVSLMDVAQWVVQNPQAYQQASAQPRNDNSQRQSDPEVAALKQKLEAMESERQTERVLPVITAFSQGRDDFQQMWPQMENIILSGILEKNYGPSLSAEQKLAEAYRMAGGSYSPSRSDRPEPLKPHSETRNVPSDDAGAKSIRGAPNGQDPDEGDDETDIRKLLKREARKLAS